jgi:Uma2 family endonuclease
MTLSLDRNTIIYPDSDGHPMADNTKQFGWIVLLKENLECLFANDPQVFVAGDLLWYPMEGCPDIRVAPDVFVVKGRPKGDRGSYRQWQEGNIAPQVVFKILSPGNRAKEMIRKLKFYEQYGVEEYYIYDPDDHEWMGLQRNGGELCVIDDINDWTSPLLGVRFLLTPETLEVYFPDGRPFLTTVALAQQVEQAKVQVTQAQRALEAEKQRSDRLLAQLKTLGVDPETL